MSTSGDVVTWAQMELGKDYVYGDEGPDTFDCSGLIQYIYKRVGIDTPRTAHEQQAWAKPVSVPQPGDLVFFGRPAYHVGLYIGGGKMIDAPGTHKKVRVDEVGHPTSYGRVPGSQGAVASALTPVTDAAGKIVGWVQDRITDPLGLTGAAKSARSIVIEGVFVVLGLALVGVGVVKAVTTQTGKLAKGVV